MTSSPIVVTTEAGAVTLRLPDVLDVANADDLRSVGEAAALACGENGVVLDFAEVTFMDSSGLGALIRIQHATDGHSKQLALMDVPPRVVRLLALSGLSDVFVLRTSDPQS